MRSLEMRGLRRLCFNRLGMVFFALGIGSATGFCAAGAGAAGQGAPQNAPQLSDQSLRALQQANAYGASIFHVQAPGPDFARQMRTAIPRDYAGMDQGIRLGLANIERDLPYLSGYFANKNQQQLASFVQTYRAKIVAPKDLVEQQVLLAEVMAFVALTSYRQHQGGGSALQQQQIQTLRNKQLQGAARSYSPTCFPGSTDATCHP